MKKIIFPLLFLLLILAGCQCSHEQWAEATCTEAKTCLGCGEAAGSPLGHDWVEASCTMPRYCQICGAADGEALGHTEGEWVTTAYANLLHEGERSLPCARCSLVLDTVAFPAEAIEYYDNFGYTFPAFSAQFNELAEAAQISCRLENVDGLYAVVDASSGEAYPITVSFQSDDSGLLRKVGFLCSMRDGCEVCSGLNAVAYQVFNPLCTYEEALDVLEMLYYQDADSVDVCGASYYYLDSGILNATIFEAEVCRSSGNAEE